MPTSRQSKASIELVERKSPPSERTNSVGVNSEIPLGRAIKNYPKIVGYVFGLITGVLLVGYDTVIIGTITALPYFQIDFGERHGDAWIIPATWLALWSALGPIGTVLGGIVAGWVQDRTGRRLSLAIGGIVMNIGIAVLFVSNLPSDITSRRGLFLLGKIVCGVALGIILATTQTYVSEIVPVSLRGPSLALFPTFILVGQLIGAIVIWSASANHSSKSYLVSFASQWPFAVVTVIMAFVVPESPPYLLRHNRADAALASEQRLHIKKVDVKAILEEIRMSLLHEMGMTEQARYIDCFKGIDLRRTLIVMFASLIPVLFGLPLLSQASYFMQTVGMGAGDSLIFLILGIALGLIANGIGVWIMSRVGRRPLSIISLSIATVLWFAMGIAGCWSGPVTIWYTAVTMMVIVIVCGLGAWPASYAVVVETSSLRLRAKAQGTGVFAQNSGNVILNLILPYLFNPDSGNLKAKIGFVYGAICLVATVGAWWAVPEMKGRDATAIDLMFESKLPARNFRSWSGSAASIVREPPPTSAGV